MCPLPALIKETESRKCRDNWQVPTINIQAKKKKKKGRKRRKEGGREQRKEGKKDDKIQEKGKGEGWREGGKKEKGKHYNIK